MYSAKNHSAIYVTGAGGFIGSHLVKGLNCLGLSRRVEDHNKVIKVENYWQAIPKAADFIIHAAEPSLVSSQISEEQYLNERLSLVNELLSLNPKYFIYLSSVLVNKGDTVYSRSKLEVEKFLENYEQSIIIRLGNIYGLRMSSSNIISEVISQINQGSAPILIRKANVSTSYMHVSDLVNLIQKITESPKPGTYYATGTKSVSSLELTRIIIDIFGNNQDIIAEDYNDKSSIECDSNSTSKTFNWYPEINIRTGLQRLKKELVIFS